MKTLLILILMALVYGVCRLTLKTGRRIKTPLVIPEEIELQLEEVDELVQQHGLPSIKIIPCQAAPSSIDSSKFGGYAYWPGAVDYPLSRKDKPLRLLAQLNLSELPDSGFLPDHGLLQFFIADEGSFGLEFPSKARSQAEIIEKPTEYRVYFHQSVDSSFVSTEHQFPISKKSKFPFKGEYSLRFESEIDLASPTDYRFEEIIGELGDLDDEVFDFLYERYDSSGCKLGGYASFTQNDPRDYTADETWSLLFQMDTVTKDGVYIMWGDAGVANFFIRPKDLDNQRFTQTFFSWDCC